MKVRALAFAAIALAICVPASVASDVIQKVGDRCPTGTYSSGDYCKAFSSTSNKGTKIIANPGDGDCPVGWYRSGGYCKAYGKRAAEEDVIQKSGDDCPRGMYSSGDFCKSYN
ncbi:MAG: hypothetical protein ABJN62_03895 [Halioglobus sp.]